MRSRREHLPTGLGFVGLLVAVVVLAIAAPTWATSPEPSGPAASVAPEPSMPPAPSVGPLPSPGPDALRVLTTTTVLADIVRNVAREHADVVSIVPPGVGPEDFEPSPADAQLLADADLIVSNGAGLDDFLQRLLDSGTGGQTPHLVLAQNISTPITVDGVVNPHFWLDPLLVQNNFVPVIAARLSAIDPTHALDYGTYGAAYQDTLTALDAYLAGVVATIPAAHRKLVTVHDAFPYLARRYGFDLVGAILANVGSEPSAGQLADLVEKVKAAGVSAVFAEAQFNPELARTLAQEAGITEVVTDLYTDALGDPPVDTYVGMIRADIERIAEALR